MHPELIKAELRMKGATLAGIARELDLTLNAVGNVIRGSRSKRVETRIAEILEKTPAEVFPYRYPKLDIK